MQITMLLLTVQKQSGFARYAHDRKPFFCKVRNNSCCTCWYHYTQDVGEKYTNQNSGVPCCCATPCTCSDTVSSFFVGVCLSFSLPDPAAVKGGPISSVASNMTNYITTKHSAIQITMLLLVTVIVEKLSGLPSRLHS